MKFFFEYLFYRFHWWNTKIVKGGVEYDWFFTGIFELSAFQSLNIVTIYLIVTMILNLEPGKFHFIGLGCVGLLFILNYLYYSRNDKTKQIFKYMKNQPKSDRKKYDFFCVSYILLTFVFFIGIVLLGAPRN